MATGSAYGESPGPHPELPAQGGTPAAELRAAVLPALRRGRCLVSFSGGRDSSVVLAAAVAAAREHGLDPPVPVTLRWPRAPETDERDWQERVVAALGVGDWERIELDRELDNLGPVAERVVRAHGVLFPGNAFFAVPLLERAAGGTLLTGMGGDALLGAEWRWARSAALLRRRLPGVRTLAGLARYAAPLPLRRRAELRARGRLYTFPWLRPAAAERALRLLVEERAGEPRLWTGYVPWMLRRRPLAMAAWSYERLARDAGAALAHPLLDPGVAAAVVRAGGRLGWPERAAATRSAFAGLLPGDLLARPGKARLTAAFWAGGARAFAAAWDGSGVDPEVVDADGLRREWASESPDARTGSLLHHVWLACGLAQPDVPEALDDPGGRA